MATEGSGSLIEQTPRDSAARCPDEDFVELVTERLVIRRFQLADAGRLAAYRSDPEVAKFQSWSTSFSETDALEFIRLMTLKHPGAPGDWFQFAVVAGDCGRLVGDCGLCCPSQPPWVAELGFSLDPAWQGQGYAGEALRAVSDYALGTLGFQRVLGVADRGNSRACRLMESMGWSEWPRNSLVPPSGPLQDHEVMYSHQSRDRAGAGLSGGGRR
jgi:RimJ/RimL family protein N-acetyltransferase